jgi:hypothetical protein
MSITERFAFEVEKRPTGVPRVEDVMDAIKKSGAELREVKQHLGSPFQAAYCMGAQTGFDVHMSICEYRSEKAAIDGREQSLSSLKMVPGRTIYRNGGTTLTIRVGSKTPADEELVKKMVKAFEGVKPTGEFAPEPPPRPAPSGRIPGAPPNVPAAQPSPITPASRGPLSKTKQ